MKVVKLAFLGIVQQNLHASLKHQVILLFWNFYIIIRVYTVAMLTSILSYYSVIPPWAIGVLVLLLLLLIFCTLGFLIEVIISNHRISRLKKKSKFAVNNNLLCCTLLL